MPATFTTYHQFREYPVDEMERRSHALLDELSRRRTVREFSDRPVPRVIIENCIRTACTAPSGANQQPWHFVAVHEPAVKRQIREAAEAEERAFYAGRAPQEWLDALEPFGTTPEKPFLDDAPWLIAIFAQVHGRRAERSSDSAQHGTVKHYYVQESVGLATGLLVAALHHAGLATLTHTPSPMGFLSQILERPANERPFLLLVTGYPAAHVRVPVISKKPFSQAATFV